MSFGRADKIHCLGVNGCPICKEQAVKLSKLKIYRGNNEYVYTLVYKKVNGLNELTRLVTLEQLVYIMCFPLNEAHIDAVGGLAN